MRKTDLPKRVVFFVHLFYFFNTLHRLRCSQRGHFRWRGVRKYKAPITSEKEGSIGLVRDDFKKKPCGTKPQG